MIESEIRNFFYMHGYTPECEDHLSYGRKTYNYLTFTNGYRCKVIDCVYLSENEVLIGRVRYSDTPLSPEDFNRLERMKSTEENFRLFLEGMSIEDESGVDTTEVIAEIKARKGQELYRSKLMALWNGKCALTAVDIPELLVGSHAKAWEYSSDRERLDEYNGFLFEARIDKLFDKYLISFDDNGRILISKQIDEIQKAKLGLSDDMCLTWINARHLPYLEYHRKKFYEAEKDI